MEWNLSISYLSFTNALDKTLLQEIKPHLQMRAITVHALNVSGRNFFKDIFENYFTKQSTHRKHGNAHTHTHTHIHTHTHTHTNFLFTSKYK